MASPPLSPLHGIGVLGLGLWDGPIVTNDAFPEVMRSAVPIDPYKGKRGDDGVIHIAGLELRPDTHPRTIAALKRGFNDPFRGSVRRRILPPDLPMSHAEADAGRAALAHAGMDASDIDIVLVQSFLPDQLQPRNAALVANHLGITQAAAWEVDSICNSSVSQLHVAASLVAAGQARHVLCTQSVAYSRVRDPGVSASFQEGDLASAFVVGPSPDSEITFAWETDGSLHDAIRLAWDAPTGSSPRRYWEQAPERLVIRWQDDLQQKVMGEVGQHAKKVCDQALGRAGVRLEEIDVFVTHHPMNWFVAFMEDTLGLKDGISVSTFEDYASVNSACVPASLQRAVLDGRVERGSRVLVFCPGAGYTFGAAVLRW
jgi:3-oxoacyl-[acyl-carrier-protein] synthase-3